MDMWTDPNLVSYMTVTAYWIQAKSIQTEHLQYYNLTIRANLIGFQCILDKHSGKHLATAFYYIIKCLEIQSKVSKV